MSEEVESSSSASGPDSSVAGEDGSASSRMAAVSSSFTLTVTDAIVGRPKKPPPPQRPLTRAWPMVAASSAASSSPATVAVMVCGVFQSWAVNTTRFVSGELSVSRATSALSLVASMFTLQPLPLVVVGSAVSRTVYVPTFLFVPPPAVGSSSSASVARLTTTPGVGVTFTALDAIAPGRSWADAATLTDSVRTAVKSAPVYVSVSVADVSPAVTVATDATVTPGTLPPTVKCDCPTPLANAVSASVTVTSAPSRFASVSDVGLLAASVAVGVTTVMVKVSTARSPSDRFVSPSWAYIVTVAAPVVFAVGVPQTCRAEAQFVVPRERPAGRPLAEYV